MRFVTANRLDIFFQIAGSRKCYSAAIIVQGKLRSIQEDVKLQNNILKGI